MANVNVTYLLSQRILSAALSQSHGHTRGDADYSRDRTTMNDNLFMYIFDALHMHSPHFVTLTHSQKGTLEHLDTRGGSVG